MSADLDAVHRALAAQIKAYIDDDWNVAAWPFSGMDYPLIEVWPGSPYHQHSETFGPNGHGVLNVEVRVMVDGANAETAFKRITRAVSVGSAFGSSVIDAIASDRTLDGTAQSLSIDAVDWEPNELSAVGTIPVRIVLKKSGAQP